MNSINKENSFQWLVMINTYIDYTNAKKDEELYGCPDDDLYGNADEDIYGNADDDLYGNAEKPINSDSEPCGFFIHNETKLFSFRKISPEDNVWRKLSTEEIIQISASCLQFFNPDQLERLKCGLKFFKEDSSYTASILKIKNLRKEISSKLKTIKFDTEVTKLTQKIKSELSTFKFYCEMLDQNSAGAWLMHTYYQQYEEQLQHEISSSNLLFLKDKIQNELQKIQSLDITNVQTIWNQHGEHLINSKIKELEYDMPKLNDKIIKLKECPWFSEDFEINKLLNACKSDLDLLKQQFNQKSGSISEICNKVFFYHTEISKALRFADEAFGLPQVKDMNKDDLIALYSDILNLKLSVNEISSRYFAAKNSGTSYASISSFGSRTYREVLEKLIGLPTERMTYQQIKKHYKKWMLQNHPDKNTDEETTKKCQLVNEAFQELTKSCNQDSDRLI